MYGGADLYTTNVGVGGIQLEPVVSFCNNDAQQTVDASLVQGSTSTMKVPLATQHFISTDQDSHISSSVESVRSQAL